MRRPFAVAVGFAFSLFLAASASADLIIGEITYTRFGGTDRLKKVSVSYDGVATFALGAPTTIAGIDDGMVGADGLAFDPFNGHILIGAQSPTVHRIDPTGPVVSSAGTGGPAAFHLSVDPSGSVVWASGIPGVLSAVPIGAAFGAVGTVVPVVGDVGALTTLIFTPSGTVYYTASGAGGFGSFGTVTLGAVATTTEILSGVPAAHGGTYDPFTGDIILFGDDHVTQIDLATDTIVADLDFVAMGLGFVNFDQGTVDGMGHLFAASNSGHLLFIDYKATGMIDDASNFLALPFLDTFLDDVAPLVGPGSKPPVVPEPASVVLLGTGLIGLVGYSRRRSS